jgi:glycolate oxidase
MTALQKLIAELGENVVITEPSRLDAMRTDRSGWVAGGRVLALIEARTVEDVQATMRIANYTGTPVVPRGAGSGLAGGANGTDGSIVISVERMNQILAISPENAYAIVEPGLINAELNVSLSQHGLWFVPDPASKNISTVGGNIATNAGGLVCTKYGVTREAVLALDVVLPDGTLLHTGRRTVKGVTGYDLTALFVGSEGTLGVIVGATVRALPLPVGGTATIGAVRGREGSSRCLQRNHLRGVKASRHGTYRHRHPRSHKGIPRSLRVSNIAGDRQRRELSTDPVRCRHRCDSRYEGL